MNKTFLFIALCFTALLFSECRKKDCCKPKRDPCNIMPPPNAGPTIVDTGKFWSLKAKIWDLQVCASRPTAFAGIDTVRYYISFYLDGKGFIEKELRQSVEWKDGRTFAPSEIHHFTYTVKGNTVTIGTLTGQMKMLNNDDTGSTYLSQLNGTYVFFDPTTSPKSRVMDIQPVGNNCNVHLVFALQ